MSAIANYARGAMLIGLLTGCGQQALSKEPAIGPGFRSFEIPTFCANVSTYESLAKSAPDMTADEIDSCAALIAASGFSGSLEVLKEQSVSIGVFDITADKLDSIRLTNGSYLDPFGSRQRAQQAEEAKAAAGTSNTTDHSENTQETAAIDAQAAAEGIPVHVIVIVADNPIFFPQRTPGPNTSEKTRTLLICYQGSPALPRHILPYDDTVATSISKL